MFTTRRPDDALSRGEFNDSSLTSLHTGTFHEEFQPRTRASDQVFRCVLLSTPGRSGLTYAERDRRWTT
jgi:hypothetical protein